MTPTRSDAPRVVSLAPSATATLAALGAAECLVGVTHHCDPLATVDKRDWIDASVHVIDDSLLNQPRPVLVAGVERLAEIFGVVDPGMAPVEPSAVGDAEPSPATATSPGASGTSPDTTATSPDSSTTPTNSTEPS